MNNFLPFLTGSRAYGCPREDSDTDIVVLVRDDAEIGLFDVDDDNSYGFTLRLGNLNVIAVDSEPEYIAWFLATQRLISWKTQGHKVSRDVAIEEIDKEHVKLGIGYKRNMGKGGESTLPNWDVPY